MTAPRITSELVDELVEAVTTGEHAVAGVAKSGRRWTDWRAIFSVRSGVSVFFWLFGVLLDERHKPSMSRIMLAVWTYCGWLLIAHELRLQPGEIPIGNAVWTSWWAAEGMLSFAVFGPSIASYFGAGAAGAVAAGTIGASARDVLTTVREKIAPAATTTTTTTVTAPPKTPPTEDP